MRTFSHKPSSLGGTNRHPLLVAIAILAALATSLAMFFSLGARPAAAQGGLTDVLPEEDRQALADTAREAGITAEQFTAGTANVSKEPESLSFGNVQTGNSSATQNATVNVDKLGCINIPIVNQCLGSFPAKIDSADVSGQGFAEVFDNCAGLQISQPCSVGVKFQPNSTGAHSGQLTFTPGKIRLTNFPPICIPLVGCVDPNLEIPTQFTDDTVVDLSGNGVTPPDTDPPSITSFSPTGKNVKPGKNVTAKFDENMLASSITAPGTFTLTKKGSNKPVPAVVTYNELADTATLNPNSSLTKGATYTAKVTTAAEDLAGNNLLQQKTWTFRVLQ